MFLAAGQVILARGEDFTPGAFMGFLFLSISSIGISFIMLRSKVFSKVTAYAGILGTVILALFTVWATYIPTYYNVA